MAVIREEKRLIEEAQRGDERSFEALILSCKGRAYNIAYRYLRNEEDALDALQESFLKIYRNLGKFNGDSKFDTWVYRIVVNTCHDMLRKYKDKPQTEPIFRSEEDGEYQLELPDSGPGPAEALENKESSGYILSCLEQVGEDHREVLILRDIKGFSYEEIAEILDCSIGTVKSRISRARQRLKDIYLKGLSAE